MKSVFVNQLYDSIGAIVTEWYLVKRASIGLTKTGKRFVKATLSDKTGEIEARMWDVSVLPCRVDDFVKVQGLVEEYNGDAQLKVIKLRPSAESDGLVPIEDFFPASKRDRDRMLEELNDWINLPISSEHVRDLLCGIVHDPVIRPLLRDAPAAMKNHHAYLGGLLEHILGLCAKASAIAQVSGLNGDLLIAGCVLHDIGKIYELSFDRAIRFSTCGQLLGHVAIGMDLVGRKIDELVGFPAELKMAILHIIASHHGLVEHGALRVPHMREAVVFHCLDLMDSRLAMMDAALDGCTEEFSDYVYPLGANVWRGPEAEYTQPAESNMEPLAIEAPAQ